jgi:serine/threonine protein kinase
MYLLFCFIYNSAVSDPNRSKTHALCRSDAVLLTVIYTVIMRELVPTLWMKHSRLRFYLNSFVANCRRLNGTLVASHVISVLEGLEDLCRAAKVHHNLRAANILLKGKDGKVTLSDFGFSLKPGEATVVHNRCMICISSVYPCMQTQDFSGPQGPSPGGSQPVS